MNEYITLIGIKSSSMIEEIPIMPKHALVHVGIMTHNPLTIDRKSHHRNELLTNLM